jgi:LysR family glycine cleavage system transcriptional activator
LAVVVRAQRRGGGGPPGWISVVSRPLLDGTLVPASPLRVRTGKHFHLLAARGKPLRDVVVAIRDWLLDQMRQDMERAGPLVEPPIGKDSAA